MTMGIKRRDKRHLHHHHHHHLLLLPHPHQPRQIKPPGTLAVDLDDACMGVEDSTGAVLVDPQQKMFVESVSGVVMGYTQNLNKKEINFKYYVFSAKEEEEDFK